MENIKCLCGEELLINNSFKKHFRKCNNFKEMFSDLDSKISLLLKKCPILLNIFLINYIKIIEKISKIHIIINEEDINNNIKNISINNIKSLELIKKNNKNYAKLLKDYKFMKKVNYKPIFIGSDIKKEQYEGIVGFCIQNYLDDKNNKNYKNNNKNSETILNYLENIIPGKWFVLISDKDSNNYFDCTLSLTNNNSIIIFSIENKKFNLILLKNTINKEFKGNHI